MAASAIEKERAVSRVFMAFAFALLGAFIGACITVLVLMDAKACFAGHIF